MKHALRVRPALSAREKIGRLCVQAAAQGGVAQKLALLAAVSALPVMYSRRIVDYNASC